MHFTKIGLEPDSCQCLNFEPQESGLYMRCIEYENISEADFRTSYEENPSIREEIAKQCNQPKFRKKFCGSTVCLSINEWTGDCEQNIKTIKKYLKIFFMLEPAPPKKSYVLIFKISPNLGKIKATGTTLNPTHCDLYKSDDFDIENIEIIEIISLNDCQHLTSEYTE